MTDIFECTRLFIYGVLLELSNIAQLYNHSNYNNDDNRGGCDYKLEIPSSMPYANLTCRQDVELFIFSLCNKSYIRYFFLSEK